MVPIFAPSAQYIGARSRRFTSPTIDVLSQEAYAFL